jgi:hypothetical protein
MILTSKRTALVFNKLQQFPPINDLYRSLFSTALVKLEKYTKTKEQKKIFFFF